MRSVLLILAVLSIAVQAGERVMFCQPLSPRIANYNIDVHLDTGLKRLFARETLTWRNTSSDTICDLQFHMYLNAFKNERSTFMRESGGRHRVFTSDNKKGWGWTEIRKIRRTGGTDLMSKMAYIQPDDGNRFDETVLRIDLDNPVLPGDNIILEIEFEAQLPVIFARTGYAGDFFMIGQWFPKIGVWEHGRGWNCHQFHLNSEFFADFGNYTVNITLPDPLITGATGVLLGETINGDNTKTQTYYCEDVHDFAWTADKNFIPFEDMWQNVHIRYLCHPYREGDAKRIIAAAKFALAYMDDWIGPYPYPVLTIVDPQYGAGGAGGMEYPTLITAGDHWLMPEGLRLPENVTVHEFAHNYFYGILASNEFEEAWLDEGMTTYSEVKMMDSYFPADEGSTLNLFGLKIDDSQYTWLGYAGNPKQDRILRPSWTYQRGGYGRFSYFKPAMMLLTLENYLGNERMRAIWHAYYDRYKFKHPHTPDFISVVNEISGSDMNWFLEPLIYGSDVLDYSIGSLSSKPIPRRNMGVFGDPLGEEQDSLTLPSDETPDDSVTIYESKIVVSREGEIKFPVEILVRFNDGDSVREEWDGIDRYRVFTYNRPSGVASAQVDPEHKVWLDINFLNNGRSIGDHDAAPSKYAWRWLFWMQNLLQFLLVLS
jgi:hypothetical protein